MTDKKELLFIGGIMIIVVIALITISHYQRINSLSQGIGSGNDDFWIEYPGSGLTVDHPQWVLDEVQFKVVLIFTQSAICETCSDQPPIYESIYNTYSSDLKYFDQLSGTDEPEATDAFSTYDPDGESPGIILTTVLSKGPDNSIIWHSWESVVDEQILSSWIEDAISYHEENS